MGRFTFIGKTNKMKLLLLLALILPSGMIAQENCIGEFRGTTFQANQIGRIDIAGNITEFATAIGPDRITTGPDGNLWFTEPFNNKIGRVTLSGVITEFALPFPASSGLFFAPKRKSSAAI